jgi:O-antigen/teichoic acid export membrane protein
LNTTIKRLTASLGANTTSQALTIFIQLLSVPIFLSIWTIEVYGEWLMLTAIPTYFALADFGFLAVIINKMTILAGSNNIKKVNVLFHTAIKLSFFVNIVVLLIVTIVVSLLDAGILSIFENKIALVLMVVCAVLNMTCKLIDAVFRSQGQFATGLQILNGIKLLEWLTLIIGLFFGQTFLWVASGLISGRVIGLTIAVCYTKIKHKNITWGISQASANEMRKLVKPALSFMSFPISNAISFQGTTIIIGVLFGPAYLAIFNTYRTVSRVIVQCVNIIAKSVEPELSKQFGEKNLLKMNKIQSRGRIITIILSLISCAFLFYSGEFLLHLWVKDKIPYQPLIFNGFLLLTLLNAVWQMEIVYLTSLNKHMKISIVYLFASLLMITLLYFTGTKLGEIGPIIILSIFEIIVGVFCFKYVFKLKKLLLKSMLDNTL